MMHTAVILVIVVALFPGLGAASEDSPGAAITEKEVLHMIPVMQAVSDLEVTAACGGKERAQNDLKEMQARLSQFDAGKDDPLEILRKRSKNVHVPPNAIYNRECSKAVSAYYHIPSAVFALSGTGKNSSAKTVAGVLGFYRQRGMDGGQMEQHTWGFKDSAPPEERLSGTIHSNNIYGELAGGEACRKMPSGLIMLLQQGAAAGLDNGEATGQTNSRIDAVLKKHAVAREQYERVRDAMLAAREAAGTIEGMARNDRLPPEIRNELTSAGEQAGIYRKYSARLDPILDKLREAMNCGK